MSTVSQGRWTQPRGFSLEAGRPGVPCPRSNPPPLTVTSVSGGLARTHGCRPVARVRDPCVVQTVDTLTVQTGRVPSPSEPRHPSVLASSWLTDVTVGGQELLRGLGTPAAHFRG